MQAEAVRCSLEGILLLSPLSFPNCSIRCIQLVISCIFIVNNILQVKDLGIFHLSNCVAIVTQYL